MLLKMVLINDTNYNIFKSKTFCGRKYSFLSFFRSSAAKCFSVGASDQQQGNCGISGSTVIPEGIMDVNKDSLHSYSEMMKHLRFLVGKTAVT